ncbi:MAG: ester cyclase [Chloroflexia bacterium]|nr:ester cyclase [Chloroflexia bacterium]
MGIAVNRHRSSVVVLLVVALLLGSVLTLRIVTAANGASSDPATVATRFFDELHTAGDLDAAAELVAPGAFVHTPDGVMRGPDGIAELVTTLRTAFPDATFPIAEVVVAGDTVLVRWSMVGTHQGEFGGIAPTGTAVKMDGIAILRVHNGRIVEDWVQYDRLGLLQQLDGTWTQGSRHAPCGECGPTT